MVHGADNVLSISGVLCSAGAEEGIWVHHKNKDNEVLRQVTEISSPVPPDGRSEVSCLSRSSI